jgi:hypothetical protein
LHKGYHKNFEPFEILNLKGPHIYHNLIIMQTHYQIDSDFIVNKMLTIIKVVISIKIVSFQATIHRDSLYDILYKKAWVAKKKVLSGWLGSISKLTFIFYITYSHVKILIFLIIMFRFDWISFRMVWLNLDTMHWLTYMSVFFLMLSRLYFLDHSTKRHKCQSQF